ASVRFIPLMIWVAACEATEADLKTRSLAPVPAMPDEAAGFTGLRKPGASVAKAIEHTEKSSIISKLRRPSALRPRRAGGWLRAPRWRRTPHTWCMNPRPSLLLDRQRLELDGLAKQRLQPVLDGLEQV